MNIKIQDNSLTIYCSKGLEEFSKEFINYFNQNIDRIKEELSIDQDVDLIVSLTDDEEQAGFVYGNSSFSGFFNDKGVSAYINLNRNKTKEYMFKALMHELVHHLYKYYVYGKDKNRITWVDEGLATFLSLQKEDIEDYKNYLMEYLSDIDDLDLNILNHNDMSFDNNNGYNLSYIAIKYLYESNNHDDFIDIIKSEEKLIELGSTILGQVKKLNNRVI